jgi:dolichyl-phosphate-mannose--protein O-mannosyl transferase
MSDSRTVPPLGSDTGGRAPAQVPFGVVRDARAWWGARSEGRLGQLAVPALLAVVALTLYLVRLGEPPAYIYDEVYHAYTAEEYVRGNADAYVWYTTAPQENVAYEWTHPPTGKLLLAGGIWIWGDSSFGWRFASAVFGAIGIGLAYLLGKRITGSPLVGLFAAGLLMVDGLYFVQSRTGMVDIFVLVFTLGALISAYDYLTLPDTPGPARWALVRTGLLLGLALSTKWNAAYAAGLIGLVIVVTFALSLRAGMTQTQGGVRTSRRRGGATDRQERQVWNATIRERLIWIPLGMGLVPAIVYLLSYTPFFLEGHSLSDFRELQRQMWWYHSNLVATHPYSSSWWQWPLAWKPVWYWVGYHDTTQARIYANGNPFLFWAMVPAVLWVCWSWWKDRRYIALTILAIGFFGQWLPWAFSPRIAFAYHFLPAVPFGALAVAVILARMWSSRPQFRYAGYAAISYLVLVVAAFAFFYPIYAAVYLTPDRLDLRYWFDSWI